MSQTIFISAKANHLYDLMVNGEEPNISEFNCLDYDDKIRLGSFPEVAQIFEKVTGMRGAPLLDEYKVADHQLNVLRWMDVRSKEDPKICHGVCGGILYLDMGLGKTLISLLHAFTNKGPFLVVSSKTLLSNWISECEKFFGKNQLKRVKIFHKEFCDIASFRKSDVSSYDIVFTTYDVIKSKHAGATEKSQSRYDMGFYSHRASAEARSAEARTAEVKGANVLFNVDWQGIFADESQTFANTKTATFASMMGLVAKTYWCLTGTPIRNKSSDLLSQLRFIGYGNRHTAFPEDPACNVTPRDWDRRGKNIYALHRIEEVIYSLDYTSAGVHIPPKHAYLIRPEFSEIEKRFYERAKNIASTIIAQYHQHIVTYASVLAIFTLLRQVCIAPYMINPEAKLKKKEEKQNDVEVQAHLRKLEAEDPTLLSWIRDKRSSAFGSTKIRQIIYYVDEIAKKGEKVIIFNVFSSALYLIKEAIEDALPSIGTVYIDGSVDISLRKMMVEEFKQSSKISVLLINSKVGSEGLNITQARYTINPGMWWSPSTDDQAEARIFRIGQTTETHCITLAMKDSIEEKVLEVCANKRKLGKDFSSGHLKQNINFFSSLIERN